MNIRAKKLKIRRSQFVLGPLDFEIKTSQLTLISGANGSGKTSLLKAFIGRLPFEGHLECPQAPIGCVGVEPLLVGGWTGIENGRWYQALFGKSGTENIDNLTPRSVRHLSSGQKRRLELQIVLSCPFSCILLDEPFNFLDKNSALEFAEKIRQKIDGGASVILTSHSQESNLLETNQVLEL